jgi:hypothetical protein
MAAVLASIGKPAELNIESYRNDSVDAFEIHIIEKATKLDWDLSIYDVITLQIKNGREENSAILEFSMANSTILWSVNASGVETGDGTDGKITLMMTDVNMEVLGEGGFVYDIEFKDTANNRRNTLVRGTWSVDPDTTR